VVRIIHPQPRTGACSVMVLMWVVSSKASSITSYSSFIVVLPVVCRPAMMPLLKIEKLTHIFPAAQPPAIGSLRGHPGDAHSPVKLLAVGICRSNDWQHSARLQALSAVCRYFWQMPLIPGSARSRRCPGAGGPVLPCRVMTVVRWPSVTMLFKLSFSGGNLQFAMTFYVNAG